MEGTSQRSAPPHATLDDASTRRVTNPRLNLLVHLAEDLREAIVVGDIEAARVAHEAIGRLLGSAATQLVPITVSARGDTSGVRR